MSYGRYKIAGTSVLLANGDLLVTSGGPQAEILRANEESFATVPRRYPDAYRFAATALLPGGDVLVSGRYASGTMKNSAGVWRIGRP